VTRVTSPFGFRSTAAEGGGGHRPDRQARDRDRPPHRASALRPLGALAGAGAQVTLAVRNTDAGIRTAADVAATTGRDDVRRRRARSDQPGRPWPRLRAAMARLARHPRQQTAGVMMSPEQRTPQGWELQFATNHLGHFALNAGTP